MFGIRGQVDGRQVSIVWRGPLDRMLGFDGLSGDREIIDRAVRDSLDGRSFRSTPTGPFWVADLDDPVASFVQLTSYFSDGYSLSGDVPAVVLPSEPEGAIQ